MASSDQLIKGVGDFFKGSYEITSGRTVPDVGDLAFGKSGKEIELAMMFIDIRESTAIVDGFRRTTAARMYKSFLWGITQIARSNEGDVRSFNGDGVLIAFSGDMKCTNAAKAALQMSWFVKNALKPKVETYFRNNLQLADMVFDFDIGIDVGKVLIVRGGIRGANNNDLVWVGNATNWAVKLSSVTDEGYHIFISNDVHKKLADLSKLGGNPKVSMWENRTWRNKTIYRSNWTWKP